MTNTIGRAELFRYQASLLRKQSELAGILKNHRIVDVLTPVEEILGCDTGVDVQRLTAESQQLREIRAALGRIADESFGICVECGEHIAVKRLRALPWARFCVLCQEEYERRTPERESAFEARLPKSEHWISRAA